MTTATTKARRSVLCSIDGHEHCGDRNCKCYCHIEYTTAYSSKDDLNEGLVGLLFEFWRDGVKDTQDRVILIQKWHHTNNIEVDPNRLREIIDASHKADARQYWSRSETNADLGVSG